MECEEEGSLYLICITQGYENIIVYRYLLTYFPEKCSANDNTSWDHEFWSSRILFTRNSNKKCTPLYSTQWRISCKHETLIFIFLLFRNLIPNKYHSKGQVSIYPTNATKKDYGKYFPDVADLIPIASKQIQVIIITRFFIIKFLICNIYFRLQPFLIFHKLEQLRWDLVLVAFNFFLFHIWNWYFVLPMVRFKGKGWATKSTRQIKRSFNNSSPPPPSPRFLFAPFRRQEGWLGQKRAYFTFPVSRIARRWIWLLVGWTGFCSLCKVW